MRARTIHTKFYNSERVLTLSKDSRWLFMYLLTCEGIGLTGAFKRSSSKVCFETGMNIKELVRAKEELQTSKLAYFIGEWIVVPQTEEKTGYSKSSLTSKAYDKEFDTLPEEIQAILKEGDRVSEIPYTLSKNDDTVSGYADTHRNKKSEIRNNLESAENLYKALESLTDLVCAEVATHYQVKAPDVLAIREELELYCRSKGKKYTDYKAALMGWVRRKIEEGKIATLSRKVEYDTE